MSSYERKSTGQSGIRQAGVRQNAVRLIATTLAVIAGILFATSCAEKEEPKNTNAAPAVSAAPASSPAPSNSPAPAASAANANAKPPANVNGNANAAAAAGATGKEITTPSGLKYIDLVIGTGPMPKTGQMVSAHYTGTLTNGTKFDSSRDRGQPYAFRIGMGNVIAGWDEGIMTMRVGGRRKLIIPPSLGYKAQGFPPKIPPNATLLFDIELVSVQ